jgi:hypothetical protein
MKTFMTTIAALAASTTLASADSLRNHPVPAGAEAAVRVFGDERTNLECYMPITASGEIAAPGEEIAYWNNRSFPLGTIGGEEEVEEEITEVSEVPYGVADGSVHERDNLTSMGASSTTGQQVMRVRSASDNNPVTIRRAGGGEVFSGTVDAGDTFVQVGGPGTYIAQTGSRSITKATGPQTFTDRTETTRTVTLTVQIGGEGTAAGLRLMDCDDVVERLRAAGWQ